MSQKNKRLFSFYGVAGGRIGARAVDSRSRAVTPLLGGSSENQEVLYAE